MSKAIILDSNTESIKYLCQKDKRLAKLISMVGSITYKPYEDSYRFLVETILGQMLSNKAADIIAKRLHQLCQGDISPDVINSLSDDELKSIGTSKFKVQYIRHLTKAIENGKILFSDFPNMKDKEIIEKLTSIHGIGVWSAKMYLIFVLNRQDVLPLEDVAFLQSYRWIYKTKNVTPDSIIRKCDKWKPYSSIAARYLYCALDIGLTKEEFHLYN